jgi:hypothetical protein
MDGFIARDFRNLGDFLRLQELVPLLGGVRIPELLGQHYNRHVSQPTDLWLLLFHVPCMVGLDVPSF